MVAANEPKLAARGSPRRDSLLRRVLSSIVLAPAALAATYYGGPVFAATIAFMATVMIYEWARMVDGGREFSALFIVLAAAGAAGLFSAAADAFAVALSICAVGALAAARAAARDVGRRGWAAFGAVYIIAPCIALIWLRDSVENGRALTFTLFFIVWMADIGAYFAGRYIGGPRISQALSPDKTWSGVVGGVLLGGMAGAAATKWTYGEGGALAFAAIGASLGLASVLGDLAESAFKRVFGFKDSSNLIPGHGGFLDRLDGMIFATTAMTFVIFLHMMLGKL